MCLDFNVYMLSNNCEYILESLTIIRQHIHLYTLKPIHISTHPIVIW